MRAGSRGAALVEFAVVGTLVLCVLLAAGEFTVMIWKRMRLQRAVLETAHAAVQQAQDCGAFAASRLASSLENNPAKYGLVRLSGTTPLLPPDNVDSVLNLTLEAEIPCQTCAVLMGRGGLALPVQVTARSMIEWRDACSPFTIDY